MTREQFISDITELNSLLEFCNSPQVKTHPGADAILDISERFLPAESADEVVENAASFILGTEGWRNLAVFLSELQGYKYLYYAGGALLWGVTQTGKDFIDAKKSILSALDAIDFWGREPVR